MRNTLKYAAVLISIVLLLSYCDSNEEPKEEPTSQITMSAADVSGAACDTLVLKPTFLSDVNILNQQCVNTFAWQYFVNLTWPGIGGIPNPNKGVQDWGKPGDLEYMVLDQYMSAEDVFGTSAPSAWGTRFKDPSSGLKLINNVHKFHDEDVITEHFQAAGGDTPWLTDQEGNLIWYEELMNQVEFEYIVNNHFYDPKAQYDSCENGSGIWLPNGSMELKTSWRIIPESQFETLKYRYKIIEAMVPDSIYFIGDSLVVSDQLKQQKLGLIGLHIIHKTPSAPQFIWATFEHVDLAPETSTCVASDVNWLLYNPNDCSTTPNVPPTPSKPMNVPIQIIKDPMATPQQDAAALNAFAHARIKAANPTSVFQYYKLVGTQWPSGAIADKDNHPYTPLADGGKTPMVLTNVSMESYVQGLSCLTCHVGAGVNQKALNGQEYPSDYSFLFGKAQPQITN